MEAENKKLRESNRADEACAEDLVGDAADDGSAAVDVQALNDLLQATIKVYGAESEQAKERVAELEAAKAMRRSSHPVSVQARAVERRADRQRKALDRAKAAATAAAAAVQSAQSALAEADARVADAEDRLQRTEAELQDLCTRAAAELASSPVGPAGVEVHAPDASSLAALASQLAGDGEAQAAVALLQQKLQAAVPSSRQEQASAAHDDMDTDVQELERQTAIAKRHLETTQERLDKAKQGRTRVPAGEQAAHGPVRTHRSVSGGTGAGPYDASGGPSQSPA